MFTSIPSESKLIHDRKSKTNIIQSQILGCFGLYKFASREPRTHVWNGTTQTPDNTPSFATIPCRSLKLLMYVILLIVKGCRNAVYSLRDIPRGNSRFMPSKCSIVCGTCGTSTAFWSSDNHVISTIHSS